MSLNSFLLERQPAADTVGNAVLEDDVDNHWGALFKAALLSTLLDVGSELGAGSDTGNNGDIIQALRRGSSDSLNQTGQKVAAVVGRPEGAKGDWFRLVEDGPEYNTRKRRLLMLGRDLFYAGRGLGRTEALDQSRFALVAALAARDSA